MHRALHRKCRLRLLPLQRHSLLAPGTPGASRTLYFPGTRSRNWKKREAGSGEDRTTIPKLFASTTSTAMCFRHSPPGTVTVPVSSVGAWSKTTKSTSSRSAFQSPEHRQHTHRKEGRRCPGYPENSRILLS